MLYREYQEFHIFEEGLLKLNIELSDVQKQQFIDFYEILIEKNKVMNLTAITEFKEVVYKHFIDSLSLIKVFKPYSEKIIDMGTGAGFPGIPLKIIYPKTEILLIDSLNKRLVFLDEVIQKLNLCKIRTLHGRAEDIGRKAEFREKYDLCLSRAVARMSSLSELCLPLVIKGGYFISYKSGDIHEEIKEAENALRLLGAKLDKIEVFELPGTDIRRSLVMVKKEKKTSEKYPRNSGRPIKNPL